MAKRQFYKRYPHYTDDQDQAENPLVPSKTSSGAKQQADKALSDIDDVLAENDAFRAGLDSQDLEAKEAEAEEAPVESTDEEKSEAEQIEESFYNQFGDKPKRKIAASLRGAMKDRKSLILAGGGGAIGVIIFGFAFFGFLNVFKLEHMLKNISAKTFSRYNAQFAGRSNTYVKAYIRVRLLEFNGNAPGDANGNLYFRADRVERGNDFKDWYRTMRTSRFEKDLLEKDGIAFSGAVEPDGHGGFKLKAAKFTIKNDSLDFKPSADLEAKIHNINGNPARLADFVNTLGQESDQFVKTQIFDSDKEARKAIKTEVNDRTRFFQVLKRRRLRKNIQNMIGVRDWTFFETTVAKYRDKKSNVQQKILSKLFPNNSDLANLLECIFTGHKCNTNSDPQHTVAANENLPDADNTSVNDRDPKTNEPKLDKDGNPVSKIENLGGNTLAKDEIKAIQETATEDLSKVTTSNVASNVEDTTIIRRIISKLLAKFVGEASAESVDTATAEVNPAAWWRWAKRIAAIQKMIDNHTLSKMVKKARLAQTMALFTMYATAGDQLKTGQVTAQGVKDLMGTVSDFDNSEGWVKMAGDSPNIASAAENVPQPAKNKKDYCSSGHVKLRDEFAWYCDDQKPNGGSTASTLEQAWNSTVGYIAKPIANAVNGIKHIPVIGSLVDSVANFVDSIVGGLANITIVPILNSLGITDSIGHVLTYVMGKALVFLGAAPIFTGGQPGAANVLISGGAGVAESSTRLAGGVASTPTTLDYSNKVAAAYKVDQLDSQSLMTRYASIDNPDSLASRSLYSVANSSVTDVASSFTNIFSNLGSLFANVFSGHIFAATNQPASELNSWSGVDTYDIPQQCQSLDPLDPNYSFDAVGVVDDAKQAGRAQQVVDSIRPSLTPELIRDESGFWKKVYDKIGDSGNAEDIAGAIYNCALMDKQVEGGLGYMYGYSNDGGLDSGAGGATSNNQPGAGGDLGIGSDGFVFPLQTTQSVIKNHQPVHWCYTSQTNCHHDYNAADIFAPTGTVIVAPKSGTVIRVAYTDGKGWRVTIKSDAPDGKIYFHNHMLADSPASFGITHVGMHVNAGQPIGRVGTDHDAEGTASHLHIDVLPAYYTSHPSCPCTNGQGYINVQPALVEAFNKLPQ